MNRSADWMAQSRHTLQAARHLVEGGYHDGACFQSQQAAEFATRSLYDSLILEGTGHSLTHLLGGLRGEVKVPQSVLRVANRLDRHYIQTRYPNGFDIGAPKDYYSEEDAKEAIAEAEAIIAFCEAKMAGQGQGGGGAKAVRGAHRR